MTAAQAKIALEVAEAEITLSPRNVQTRRLLHQYVLHGTNRATMHRGVSVGVLLKSKRRRHRMLCLCVYGPPMPVPRVFHEG